MSELSMKNKDIEMLIKEQLQIIDDKLIHSDKGIGDNYILHNLPTNMTSVTGIDKKDAQRILYNSIIYSLEKRGFSVKITLEDLYTTLYISWKSEINSDSMETMNKIIKTNRISKEDLQRLTNRNISRK